jgi:hypothetical protein
MKRILLSLAAVSAFSVIGFPNARAADPLPPVPPGGSVAPAPSSTPPSSTPPGASTSQQVPLTPNSGGQGEHAKFEKLKQELGLTPEQVRKIGPILKNAHQQAKTVRENASLNEQQKHRKLHEIFAAAIQQFRPILTQAQLARLKQLRAERRGTTANT